MVGAVETQLLRLIGAVYEAAANPALWPVFYHQYAQLVGADFVGIQVHDFRRKHSRFLSYASSRPQIAESYHSHYNELNLWRERGKYLFRVGRLVRAQQHTPLEILDRSEFYNDFLKLVGVRYSFNTVLGREAESATVFSVSRGVPRGSFEDSGAPDHGSVVSPSCESLRASAAPRNPYRWGRGPEPDSRRYRFPNGNRADGVRQRGGRGDGAQPGCF